MNPTRFPALLLPLLALVVALAACRTPPPGAIETRLDEPHPDSVEVVLFLIGDAGEALPGRSPVVTRLQQDVEAWTAALGRDSAVAIVFLGDNVYPVGIRERTDPEYEGDTLRLRAQLDVVSGENARRHRAVAFFMAGNHDWGNMIGAAGLRRLINQQEHIEAARREGLLVSLVPRAGDPGPDLLDLGSRLRLVFLDTHWWLQTRPALPKLEVMRRVEEAMQTSVGRQVVFTSHHPFVSGGAHGGPLPVWEGLGVLWLLRQTGSLVQDLNSWVYKELRFGLKEIFGRTGPPLVFAGGHDHSLQVIEDVEPDEPVWSLVSGSGSKVTEVANVSGMKYAEAAPGFMRLSFLRNGGVLLHVYATSSSYKVCPPPTTDGGDVCMEEGLAAFDTRYTLQLN